MPNMTLQQQAAVQAAKSKLSWFHDRSASSRICTLNPKGDPTTQIGFVDYNRACCCYTATYAVTDDGLYLYREFSTLAYKKADEALNCAKAWVEARAENNEIFKLSCWKEF